MRHMDRFRRRLGTNNGPRWRFPTLLGAFLLGISGCQPQTGGSAGSAASLNDPSFDLPALKPTHHQGLADEFSRITYETEFAATATKSLTPISDSDNAATMLLA